MRKLMLMVLMLVAVTASAQQLDLKSLDKFAAKAKSKTEINMDESMVKSALSFLSDEKKDEFFVKKNNSNLKGFYLRNYEFEGKDAVKLEDLKPLTDQLKAPNWVSFLRNQEGDEQTEIWMHRTNGEPDGILLLNAEGGELTVINALGLTRLDDLNALGQFGNAVGKQQAKAGEKKETKKNDDN